MTKEPISMDKEYTTRDGTPVRIYATDAGDDEFPVHAAYYEGGQWWQVSYTRYGQLSANGLDYAVDLIEKPKTHKIVRYMNVYPDGRVSFRYTLFTGLIFTGLIGAFVVAIVLMVYIILQIFLVPTAWEICNKSESDRAKVECMEKHYE